MKANENIGLLVLAAGASSRLGQPKQLVKFEDKPLLQHILDIGKEVNVNERVLVLGAKSELIQEVIIPGAFSIVHNYDWEKGMSTSIKVGLKSLQEKHTNLKHVIIMLSDQPYVTIEIINQLIASQDDTKPCITTCSYANQMGVPAIFSHHFFADLLKLTGDQGARKLIQQKLDHVRTIPFSKGVIDIDTPDDLGKLE
ncbi:molybdenum cofactor cytidylyltransferase [Ekhidna lutea]|uniref:Molybdenum cofactor cytidylyltransferase n=1 Tax=Ekhidna lutea TaxID=447679 RepID=A0A239M9M9_EKHLU|nr:nucleotidyltransferase family protein [Ekhidna lutea]SNT39466.1 molybdenum cofactor cytidylyltransferase [Ekhidna lutea]